MKNLVRSFVLTVSVLTVQAITAVSVPLASAKGTGASVSFMQNKGQIHDQNGNARPDVLFSGQTGGMLFHLRNNGISYQLTRVESWREAKMGKFKNNKISKKIPKIPALQSIYRVDVSWLGINSNYTIQEDQALAGTTNYLTGKSVYGVKRYSGLTYKNIYDKIDLHYYESAGGLKFDFLAAPGSDYKNIQLKIDGAEKIQVQKNGSLLLKTPLGDIEEGAPVVFQSGKQLNAKWIIRSNILSFEIDNYDASQPLIIDPTTRLWGTYYGGSNDEVALFTECDASNNVYIVGLTEGATGTVIATSGSHMSTFGGGSLDGFIAKFNSAGVRQWGTYYGGTGDEFLYSIAVMANGDFYTTGANDGLSGAALSTSGAHQVTTGGGLDAHVAKFNSAGVRQWASYYGGTGDEEALSCSVDGAGNLYFGGYTDDAGGTAVATTGAHQSMNGGTYDGFVVKFSALGVRQWGTFYGDSGFEQIFAVEATSGGDVFAGGSSESSGGTTIATSGAFQTAIGGMDDGFLVKFNTAGVRQWGTYIGGADYESVYGVSVDASGNSFVGGDTESSSGISSSGAYKTTYGGNGDAFFAKFNSSGTRQFASYYGGSLYDDAYGTAVDPAGNFFLSGSTESTGINEIASPGSHQTAFGGFGDAYLVKLTNLGSRVWGTYYGGNNDEVGYCTADAAGDAYMTGPTDSGTGTVIATSTSHQPNYGGGSLDGYLVKFSACSAPTPSNSTSQANLKKCAGQSTTLTATGASTITWYSSPTGGTAVNTGSAYVLSNLSAGTYTYYAEAVDCAVSASRAAVTLTVNNTPTVTAITSKSVICVGETATLTAAGAATYTWTSNNTGATYTVSPPTQTIYTVTGVDANGCASTATITQGVGTCVGIKDYKNSLNISIYPNPTSGDIYIESVTETNIMIVNAIGQIVFSEGVRSGISKIKLPEQKGIYFVHLNAEGNSRIYKVVKQ